MRRATEGGGDNARHSRWVQWLNDRPAPFYLLAAVVVTGLLIAFVLWLQERTLALFAGVAFAAMLASWTRKVWCEWRDAEPMERIIGVVGCVLLLGSAAVNLVRFVSFV